MTVRMLLGVSKSHSMTIPKDSAGVMAEFLEKAGFSGEIRATVLTQIKGVKKVGVVVGELMGQSAVRIKVQASTSQDERRLFNLIVPSGHRAEDFHKALKKTEEELNRKAPEGLDEEEDTIEEVAIESAPVEVPAEAEVVPEADEETVLIGEAYKLDDERKHLDERIEQLANVQTSSFQALERKRVERTSLERRLAVLSQEIMEAEAITSRDAGVLVALRERHRQVVARREEIEVRVSSLSAQRSVDEAVSRAKPTVDGLMSELKGLSEDARREALQKIVAMLES